MKHSLNVMGLIVLVVMLYTCKKDQSKDPATDYMTYENSKGLISAGGGKITVQDKNSPLYGTSIDIPQGAINTTMVISINKPASVYSFQNDSTKLFVSLEPSGTIFQKPINISIPYDQNQNPDSLKVYYFDESNSIWKSIPKISVDKAKQVIIAQTNHFTVFTAAKNGVQFDLDIFKNGSKIYGKVWLITSLLELPTSGPTLWSSGISNVRDLISKYPFDVHAYYKIYLKEKVDFWFDKEIDSKVVVYGIWRNNNFTSYEVRAKSSDGNVLMETNDKYLSIHDVELYFSGRPLVIYFQNAKLDNSKSYYLEAKLYFINSWGGVDNSSGFWGTNGYFISSYDGAKSPSQMQPPPDADGDGIVDAYDPQNGNPPSQPTQVFPGNNITEVYINPTLEWSCSDPDGDPLTFDIYFGTDNPPSTTISTNQTATSIKRSNLNTATAYYWKVVAKDNHGNATSSPVWIFTTTAPVNNPPAAPSNPSPTNGSTGQSILPTLSWSCSDPDGDDLKYDVYFGTNSNPSTAISTNQTNATISRSGLNAGTTYYWKIVAKDSKGASTSGPIWNFTTNTPVNNPPTAPSSPSPVNGSTGQSTSPTLSWSCSDPDGDQLTYDIYFGTSSNPTTTIATNQSTTSINQSGLNQNTIYYWKIVAKDNMGATTSGPIWSFTSATTINNPPSIPSNHSPSDGSTDVSTAPTLTWNCSDPENDPMTYDVYFGTISSPTTQVGINLTTLSIKENGLNAGVIYYWKVVAKDNHGNSSEGSIWSFTTQNNSIGGIIFNPDLAYGSISDNDGNTYKTIQIGTQTWMAENLKTTKYENGDIIGTTSLNTCSNTTAPRYQWAPNDDESLVPIYGRLYSGNVVTDSRNVCPSGWHISSDADWTILTDYLGGGETAGGKLKESSTSHWLSPNIGATNESGFTAVPSGIRLCNSLTDNFGTGSSFWCFSSNDVNADYLGDRMIFNTYNGVSSGNDYKLNGYAIRCVKDSK
jgi:uncharacterized protein (TIGR02145 family)